MITSCDCNISSWYLSLLIDGLAKLYQPIQHDIPMCTLGLFIVIFQHNISTCFYVLQFNIHVITSWHLSIVRCSHAVCNVAHRRWDSVGMFPIKASHSKSLPPSRSLTRKTNQQPKYIKYTNITYFLCIWKRVSQDGCLWSVIHQCN